MSNNDSALGCGWFNLVDFYTPNLRWRLHASPGHLDQLVIDKDGTSEQLHGVMHEVKAADKTHLIGYFSSHLHSKVNAPDYAKSLFVVVDNVVLGNEVKRPTLRLTKRAFTRRFEAASGGGWTVAFEYSWPFYREMAARLFTDPFKFESKDFLAELVATVGSARPEWVANPSEKRLG